MLRIIVITALVCLGKVTADTSIPINIRGHPVHRSGRASARVQTSDSPLNQPHIASNARPTKATNFHKVMELRCGSSIQASPDTMDMTKENPPTESCAIIVSTSVGSVFLDKKKKLTVPRNSTVADLKHLVQKKFPGCPPTALQRLFLGVRVLSDNEIIGNLTVNSVTPILLDMITGTSVYNKTLSISQALEAHAALIVQQSYLGAKMLESYSDISQHNNRDSKSDSLDTPVQMESGLYRDMFEAVNRTLYETYADDIAVALERETEPETSTDDTAAWRGKRKVTKPLTAALAREFDLNLRGIRSFLYYSVLLGVGAHVDFLLSKILIYFNISFATKFHINL